MWISISGSYDIGIVYDVGQIKEVKWKEVELERKKKTCCFVKVYLPDFDGGSTHEYPISLSNHRTSVKTPPKDENLWRLVVPADNIEDTTV